MKTFPVHGLSLSRPLAQSILDSVTTRLACITANLPPNTPENNTEILRLAYTQDALSSALDFYDEALSRDPSLSSFSADVTFL